MKKLKTEANAFDKQAVERIEHGFVPDLQNLQKVDWLYNNPWREPEFAKIQWFPTINKIIERAVETGQHVLEVGCGCGMLSLELARNGLDVTGIDISPKSIEVADKFKVKYKYSGTLNYYCDDFTTFRSIPEMYDTIIFFRSLHHFKNIKEIIKKSYRLLRENGTIIICEPIRNNFNYKSAEFALTLRTILPTWEPNEIKLKPEWTKNMWDEKTQEIYKEYTYEGDHKQSVMDNSVDSDKEIITTLIPYFHINRMKYSDAFIDKLIGGLRGENRFELARFLKFIDNHMVENKILKPTSVTIFASKREIKL